MSLSVNIKKYRIEKGMTQESLASALGVSAQAVSKWETSDTYPDGSLLAPLARELDVSLDVLFDIKNAGSTRDLSFRIRKLMLETPKEKRFDVACDIGWMIEKGMFNCITEIQEEEAERLKYSDLKSYVFDDYGFTYLSNGNAPFFSVFSCPEKGYCEAVGDGEQMRLVFEHLSNKNVMNALIYLNGKTDGYTFDAAFLAKECGIENEEADNVMDSLEKLNLVFKSELEIDGKMKTLYHNRQSFIVIALMLFAREVNYNGTYTLVSHTRNNKPII